MVTHQEGIELTISWSAHQIDSSFTLIPEFPLNICVIGLRILVVWQYLKLKTWDSQPANNRESDIVYLCGRSYTRKHKFHVGLGTHAV